jgi:hypothetical protein
MRKGFLGLVGLCSGIALVCFCGDKGNNPVVEPATTTTLAELKLDNSSVAGWADSTYINGDTTNAFSLIDGGAITNIKYGMRYFSRQKMQDSVHSATLDVFDFITVQNAKNQFAYSASHGVGSAWGTYSPAKVLLSNTDYYVTVTAQINKYYFELSFTVDNGDTVALDATADMFYKKYLALIK